MVAGKQKYRRSPGISGGARRELFRDIEWTSVFGRSGSPKDDWIWVAGYPRNLGFHDVFVTRRVLGEEKSISRRFNDRGCSSINFRSLNSECFPSNSVYSKEYITYVHYVDFAYAVIHFTLQQRLFHLPLISVSLCVSLYVNISVKIIITARILSLH